MKLNFLNFVLDKSKQTLFHGADEIKLSKNNYLLLCYLTENHNRLMTKDEIMAYVWNGRIVSDNSLNQNISALRKMLSDFDDQTIIETEFGKGFKFVPEISFQTENTAQNESKKWYRKPAFMAIVGFVMIMLITHVVNDFFNPARAGNQNYTPVIMLNSSNPDDWLESSTSGLINMLVSLPKENNLITTKNNQQSNNQAQFLDNYWRINPETEAIKAHLESNTQTYQLHLSVIRKDNEISETISHPVLYELILKGNQWLVTNSKLQATQTPIEELITNDPHALELYLRGFHELKQGNFPAAENYAELAIEKNPQFHLARLLLAETKYRQGDNESSLAKLETLIQINTPPELQIPIESLRGDILDTAGRYDEAVQIYEQIIKDNTAINPIQLLDVRYNLSYTLATLLRYQDALYQLNLIKQQINPTAHTELYAHTLQKEGSVLLQIGKTKRAKQAANESIRIFTELADDMSAAKVKILLARIANHESDYEAAVHHLTQAVTTYRAADFALGVGATLNELIYAQRINGQLSAAWKNMTEMRQIALDIDYFAMLMAASEAEFEIALNRGQLDIAEQVLDAYLNASKSNDFARGLFKHNLMSLSLVIEKKQPELTAPFIQAIEQHINESQEERLRPRLNVQIARVKLLLNQPEEAINLLEKARTNAHTAGDQETVNLANSYLLKIHHQQNNWPAMEKIIDLASDNEPQPYPFLLYHAKLMQAQGNLIEAISLAQLCKQQANELWRSKDANYLQSLINLQNQ